MQGKNLYLPVILGTVRKGSQSQHVARAVYERISRREGVESELIDLRRLPMPIDDAGQDIKHPAFAEKMDRADGLVIVSPEYNHSFPGLLKHVLDSCLKEYIHKAAGVVGVSAGPWGGTRGIQNLLPALRELGLVTIFWDVTFAFAQKAFAPDGTLTDVAYGPRIDKFLAELEWMATVLRHGRENVTLKA